MEAKAGLQALGEQAKGSGGAVMVTGGSGYIGSALVKQLSRQGETVVSMYRHRLPDPAERVYPVCSDMSCEDLLAAPLRGVDTVVHLAWENTFIGSELMTTEFPLEKKHWSKNIVALKNLLNSMEKAKTRRLIFVSAMGASFRSPEAFLKEKYVGEFFVLNSQIPEKIIVRPCTVYGGDANRDQFTHVIKKIMRFPGFYPLPRWSEKLYPLSLDECVSYLAKLIHVAMDSAVKVMPLSGAQGLKVEEIFKVIAANEGMASKIGLGSMLGQGFLSIAERKIRREKDGLRLRHFLVLGQKHSSNLAKDENVFSGIDVERRNFSDAYKTVKSLAAKASS